MTETLGAETVYIHAPVELDSFGDPVAGAAPAPVVVDGCAVYPRGASTETEFRASTVIDGITILMPGDIDVDSQASIEWRDRRYDVVGEVGIWTYLDGTSAGTQVNGKRAVG